MKKTITLLGVLMILWSTSCKKYLDAKSDSKLSTITSLADVQSLLDGYNDINTNQVGCSDFSSDDFYLLQAYYDTRRIYYQRLYTWENSGVFANTAGGSDNDWSSAFRRIYIANTVLENVDKVSAPLTESTKVNDVKGQGYFLRGYNYLQLVWAFSKAYSSETANADLGLPLRLSTDFNQETPRSSVQQTYDQLIQDLKRAAALLPVNMAVPNPTRPGKAAAYGALARAYLSMRDYPHCLAYADSSLQIQSNLVDYNQLNPNASTTFTLFQVPEVIYIGYHYIASASSMKIDSNLVRSYENNDLRKKLFYAASTDNSFIFKGSYYGQAGALFDGPAVDEMYLMRAECYARAGNVEKALADVNTLLKYRMDKTNFVPVIAAAPAETLSIILQERRKELIFRGLRWMDIKRLNLEGANISLTRHINNQVYTLPANSPRFAIPLPDDILTLGGYTQNPY
ncbi:SusD family protein [bacterium A37T11]|nr:SusD family protein [bacterium A37T11]